MSAIVGKRIAIVGGGPGGLTLARLLQQSGAQLSVYERDQSRSARVQGSALDLHENSGLAALEAAGLVATFSIYFLCLWLLVGATISYVGGWFALAKVYMRLVQNRGGGIWRFPRRYHRLRQETWNRRIQMACLSHFLQIRP